MLEIRPTHLKPAREFVGKYHRHNIPPVGGKFAISCFEGERLCGVAICGRPTARKLDDGATLEIYRNCTDGTAKCSLYYTPETDGLSQSWDRGGAVFCNPPYGREIGKWVQKAFEEARGGYPIVLLIPARTDTAYFHDYIYGKAEIRFVRGRLRFTDDDGNAADPAPFPSMVVIYNGERVKE